MLSPLGTLLLQDHVGAAYVSGDVCTEYADMTVTMPVIFAYSIHTNLFCIIQTTCWTFMPDRCWEFVGRQD